jgi:hypothetical protein
MPDRAWHVVRVTTGTWEQRTVGRYRSRDAARTHRALSAAFTAARTCTYHCWENR